MSVDYVNAFNSQYTYAMAGEKYLEFLQPIRSYIEYFEQDYPRLYSYTMGLSDLGAVSALDNLITAFNSDLARIKTEKDIEFVKKLLKDIDQLVHSKKS